MPLLPYLLTAAALLSTLGLFATLKLDLWRDSRRHKRRIETMMVRLNEAERTPEPAAARVPAPPRAGLNRHTRVYALRMLRRGEDVGHVAAALGVPRREVELLVRVQSAGRARAMNAGSE